MNTQKRLYRSTSERMFAGVCGGIAEYLEVDPTLVRLAFVALMLMGGPGLVIYIVLMIVVPEAPRKKKNAAYLEDHVEGDDAQPNSDIPTPVVRSEYGPEETA